MFLIPITTEVKQTGKNGEKLQEPISQKSQFINNRRLPHCQIFLIILLNELIKLNVNMDMIIESVKRVE